MAVHAPVSDVGKSRFDLLADVDAIHDVIPRGRLREAANELEGLNLDASTLRNRSRHDGNVTRLEPVASGSFC